MRHGYGWSGSHAAPSSAVGFVVGMFLLPLAAVVALAFAVFKAIEWAFRKFGGKL